jgi:hypothetical protein
LTDLQNEKSSSNRLLKKSFGVLGRHSCGSRNPVFSRDSGLPLSRE